jgi:hypothetical protein
MSNVDLECSRARFFNSLCQARRAADEKTLCVSGSVSSYRFPIRPLQDEGPSASPQAIAEWIRWYDAL